MPEALTGKIRPGWGYTNRSETGDGQFAKMLIEPFTVERAN